MISSLFFTFFRISITTGVLILLLYGSGSLLDRFYAAGWKCWLWLLLAVRLMIPFAPSFPGAPVHLNVNGFDTGTVQQILKNVQEGLQIRGETGQIHSENGQSEQENGQLLSRNGQLFQEYDLSDQKNGLPDQENGRQLSDNLQPDRENGSAPVQSITVWVNALLPLIWILGILIFSLYQFIKYHVYRKQIIRWSHGVRNQVISGKLEQLKKQMHIMGEISVLVSRRADSPMIIGLIRPGTGFFLYGPFHGLEEPGVQKAFQALLQALCAVCHHQSDGRNHQALDLGLPSLWQHPGRGNPLGSPVLPRACRRPDDLAPVQLRHRPHPGIHLHHSDYIVSGTVLYGRIMKAQILVTT